MVRAKFCLSSIKEMIFGPKELSFHCVYDLSIPEDQRFQKATPSGNILMLIDNPAAMEQFTLGKSYYVDFTPVE